MSPSASRAAGFLAVALHRWGIRERRHRQDRGVVVDSLGRIGWRGRALSFQRVPLIDRGVRRLRQDDEDEVVLFAKRDDVQITQPLPTVYPDAIESRAVLALEIFEDVSAGLGVEEDTRVGL